MTSDTHIDRHNLKHAYEQAADKIAARIQAGYYQVKLPAERALAEEYAVSYLTLRRAMAILRERGLIVSIHGRGTFVAAAITCPPPPARPKTPPPQIPRRRQPPGPPGPRGCRPQPAQRSPTPRSAPAASSTPAPPQPRPLTPPGRSNTTRQEQHHHDRPRRQP